MCVSLESRALTPAVWATWPAQRKKKNCFSECCCGGGGGGGGEGVNRNFLGQKNHPFYFVTTRRGEKAKAAGGGGIIALVYRANASLEPRLFVVLPISPLSRKNVFLSPRTSDGVECATGERGRGKKTSSLSLRYVFLQTNRSCCASKWHLWRRSVAFVAAQNQEMGTFFSLF